MATWDNLPEHGGVTSHRPAIFLHVTKNETSMRPSKFSLSVLVAIWKSTELWWRINVLTMCGFSLAIWVWSWWFKGDQETATTKEVQTQAEDVSSDRCFFPFCFIIYLGHCMRSPGCTRVSSRATALPFMISQLFLSSPIYHGSDCIVLICLWICFPDWTRTSRKSLVHGNLVFLAGIQLKQHRFKNIC